MKVIKRVKERNISNESEGECFIALEVVYYCGGESVQECEGNTKVLKKKLFKSKPN